MLDADTTTQPVASNENDVCEGRSARRAVEGETTVTRVELHPGTSMRWLWISCGGGNHRDSS